MKLAPTNAPNATPPAGGPQRPPNTFPGASSSAPASAATPRVVGRPGRRPENITPEQLVKKTEDRRKKMREKGKEYRKLSKPKRMAGTFRREVKIVGKLHDAIAKWRPVEGIDLDKVRATIKSAMAKLVESADRLEELPEGVGRGVRGGPREKTLAVGDTVRVRDKMAAQYEGTLEAGKVYKVAEFRAAMVRLDLDGAAAYVPRGHLVRA